MEVKNRAEDIRVVKDIKSIESATRDITTHVTFGVFDGVHLGHQALIKRTVSSARKSGSTPAVFTFCNHPLKVLAPPYAPPRLSLDDARVEQFASLGIRLAIMLPFNPKLACLSPEKFARDFIAARLKARHLVCGYNFRFGKGGAGDLSLLKTLGEELGFSVEEVPPVKVRDVIVSSTKIREFLTQGLVHLASEFLGRPSSLQGRVIKGTGRGKTLDYPTANLEPHADLLIPASGVYAVRAQLESQAIPGMINIGFNPTFSQRRLSIEVHLFDFGADLVGKTIEVRFIKRMRNERKFKTRKDLANQLKKDEQTARRILK